MKIIEYGVYCLPCIYVDADFWHDGKSFSIRFDEFMKESGVAPLGGISVAPYDKQFRQFIVSQAYIEYETVAAA